MRSLLAHVMHGRDWLPTREVIRLLLEAGSPNKPAARQMLTQHLAREAVERIGDPGDYRWRLVNRDGTAPAPRTRRPNREGNASKTLEPIAEAYAGPVFDRETPLVPSLGLPVDQCVEIEVIPPHMARLVDSLHRRVFEERRGVE